MGGRSLPPSVDVVTNLQRLRPGTVTPYRLENLSAPGWGSDIVLRGHIVE
jgi:hypothetical protein